MLWRKRSCHVIPHLSTVSSYTILKTMFCSIFTVAVIYDRRGFFRANFQLNIVDEQHYGASNPPCAEAALTMKLVRAPAVVVRCVRCEQHTLIQIASHNVAYLFIPLFPAYHSYARLPLSRPTHKRISTSKSCTLLQSRRPCANLRLPKRIR